MNEKLGDALLGFVESHSQMTVGEVVEEFSERTGIRVDEVARSLYHLREDEKIRLEDPAPPRSLIGYMCSLYGIWFLALVSVIALTALSIYLLPQGPPFIYLRYVMGSLSVLYLPGSAFIEALFQKKEELEPLERLALSIGLSMALVPLVGLILNYTPWGIRLNSVFSSISLLTIALSLIAVRRKFDDFKM